MIKGQVEGVPLQSLSGLLGTVLNNKTIVKNRVQTGMLPKVNKNIGKLNLVRVFQNHLNYVAHSNISLHILIRFCYLRL